MFQIPEVYSPPVYRILQLVIRLPSMEITPDKEAHAIIRRYKETGDPQVLNDLFKSYIPFVHAIARKILIQETLTEEAVQEIFIVLHKYIDRYHEDRHNGSFKAWVSVVARRMSISAYRKKKRVVEKEESNAEQNVEPAAPEPRRPEFTHLYPALRQALNEMSPKYGIPLKLFYIDGLSYKEIAGMTGETFDSVKNSIKRGKEWLKKRLR